MPDNAFIQYGCFGILAILVVWALWRGIPNALEKHENTVAGLVAAFTGESAASRLDRDRAEERCRQERQDLQKQINDLWKMIANQPKPPG